MLPLLIEGRISRNQWDGMCENAISELRHSIFAHYRKSGFPYYKMSLNEKLENFNKLKLFLTKKIDNIITGNTVGMTMHGLALAWSYFPHSWEVRCGKMKTPMEVYCSDELFMRAIERRMRRGTYISMSGIRKALRSHTGAQGVSNFRPTAAAAIYKKFCKPNSVVWDMSCGYGGRLLGAMTSGVVGKYIGTEPCLRTFNGLISMQKELPNDLKFDINMVGSENFIPKEVVDLCFTSPPYFDTEKYSDENTQSYIKYSSNKDWNNNFLGETIKNCMKCLRPKGFMVVNIANVKTHKNLESDFVEISIKNGFRHIDTMRLSLSSISSGGYKYEPVFVMQKP